MFTLTDIVVMKMKGRSDMFGMVIERRGNLLAVLRRHATEGLAGWVGESMSQVCKFVLCSCPYSLDLMRR